MPRRFTQKYIYLFTCISKYFVYKGKKAAYYIN